MAKNERRRRRVRRRRYVRDLLARIPELEAEFGDEYCEELASAAATTTRCRRCGGTGLKPRKDKPRKVIYCPVCGGNGWVERRRQTKHARVRALRDSHTFDPDRRFRRWN